MSTTQTDSRTDIHRGADRNAGMPSPVPIPDEPNIPVDPAFFDPAVRKAWRRKRYVTGGYQPAATVGLPPEQEGELNDVGQFLSVQATQKPLGTDNAITAYVDVQTKDGSLLDYERHRIMQVAAMVQALVLQIENFGFESHPLFRDVYDFARSVAPKPVEVKKEVEHSEK